MPASRRSRGPAPRRRSRLRDGTARWSLGPSRRRRLADRSRYRPPCAGSAVISHVTSASGEGNSSPHGKIRICGIQYTPLLSPNTPLSSRGRGATEHPREANCGPGLLQRMVRHGLRPDKAAKTRLPHHAPRRDGIPARPRRRAIPPHATAWPWRRGGSGAPSGRRRFRRRQPPGPPPLLTTTCQRPKTRILSALECRTPRSAAGAWARDAQNARRPPRSAAADGSATAPISAGSKSGC